MSESKSPLDRIYRLIASHAWMTENEAKVLLSNMIEEYPEHTLTKKATQLLQDL